MSKRKEVKISTAQESASSDIPITDDDLTSEEQDALVALTDIEGASEATWQIHRVKQLSDPKPPGFEGELSSAELRLSEIQRRFGRGKYRIRGMRSNGQYIGGKTVEIASDTGNGSKEKATATSGGDVVTLLERMNDREEKNAERRRELLMLAIPAAITALPGILSAMSGARNQPDVVTLLSGLKNLVPAPSASPDFSPFILKMFDRLAELKDPNAGKDDSLFGMVKDLLKDVTPIAIAKLTAPAPPPQIQKIPQLQVNTAPAANPQVAQSGDANMLALLNWARATLAELVEKAKRNKDTSLYADLLLDNVPDGVDVAKFIEYLSAHNWWSTLQQFYPGVAPYQGWFHQFRDDLLGAYEEMHRDLGEPTPSATADVLPFDSASVQTDPIFSNDSNHEPPEAA